MTVQKTMNPDMKVEVKQGMLNSVLFIIGLVLEIVGIATTFANKIAGTSIWIIGTGLIVYTLVKNFKQEHGKGFRIANIVVKILLMALSTVFIVLVYGYPG